MRSRSIVLVGAVLIGMLLLAGCQPPKTYPASATASAGIPAEEITPTVGTPTLPTLPVYGPESYPAGMDPLTGLMVADPALLDRCPMIIKVSNYPRSGRPHFGLSQADLVFDYYIGEGMNRFAALFYGQDATQVGPIRSGRLVDAQLATLFQGVLAFKGAWFKVNEVLYGTLKKRAISGSPSTCPGICDSGDETVISMFANTTELAKYVLDKGICDARTLKLAGMAFSQELPKDGRDAPDLAINFNAYNRAEWHYDLQAGAYLRWIESVSGEEGQEELAMVPLLDAGTGRQLAFNNVIVLFARHEMYAPTYFDMVLQGNATGARAMLFRDGKAFDAIWKSAGDDRPLQFFTPEGEILAFKPGNTWLVIVGSRSTLTTPPDEMWEVTNVLP